MGARLMRAKKKRKRLAHRNKRKEQATEAIPVRPESKSRKKATRRA